MNVLSFGFLILGHRRTVALVSLRRSAVLDLSLDPTTSRGGGFVAYLTSASTAHANLEFIVPSRRLTLLFKRLTLPRFSFAFITFIYKKIKKCALFFIIIRVIDACFLCFYLRFHAVSLAFNLNLLVFSSPLICR